MWTIGPFYHAGKNIGDNGSLMDTCWHTRTSLVGHRACESSVLPSGGGGVGRWGWAEPSSPPCLPVSVGRSPAHSYRARFDYVLIQSSKAERAPLIFFFFFLEIQNNAYWTERNMADSWTRLSPDGKYHIRHWAWVYVYTGFSRR